MEENYDSTWLLYEPMFTNTLRNFKLKEPSYDYEKKIPDISLYWSQTEEISDMLTNKIKETPVNTVLTEQQQIDAEVREAIAAPRRAREVALRVAAVNALGIDDTHESGTVMRFKRKFGANVYDYAVMKADNEKWYMTGANSSHSPYTWESLTEWMTTGENLITDLQIADTWTKVTWSADPTTVTDAA